MTTATADTLQLHDLWVALATESHLPIDTLTLDRTSSYNYSLTIRVRSLQDVQAWAAILDQPVHLAGADGLCAGELAEMWVVVTSRGAP